MGGNKMKISEIQYESAGVKATLKLNIYGVKYLLTTPYYLTGLAEEITLFYKTFWSESEAGVDWRDASDDNPQDYVDDFFETAHYLKEVNQK